RILQKDMGKLEGPDSDITLTITGSNTANHPGVAIDTVIAHKAAGGQRSEGQIVLRGALAWVGIVLTYQLLQDAGGTAQGGCFGAGERPAHADSEPRPGRGLPVDHFSGQAEIRCQLPDFKFEQTSQGLDDCDLETRREATNIVVGF